MKTCKSPSTGDNAKEVSALIDTLHQTGQRLEELTAGEVDTVADRDGRTFLLQRAQEHLRYSEAVKQAAIINSLPAHIALLDKDGVILSVNQAWGRFAGANALQNPNNGIGANYLEICELAQGTGTNEAQLAAAGIRSVLAGSDMSFSFEYACHSPTQQRWFLMTVTPLSENILGGAVVMHLNISERKQAENKLLRLAEAIDATVDAIYLVDRASMRFVHVNNAACRMLKQSREELLALGPAGVLSIPEDELARTYDSIIASGKPSMAVEMLRQRNDGSQVWIELRREAQRSEDGWVIITMVRDITERKMVSDALAESDRRFSDMMANIDLVSIVIDPESRIIYCNDYFLALTGWHREELLGEQFVDLMIPADLRDEVRDVHSAMVDDLPAARHHENEILTRSGERRLIRWSNTVLRSASGEMLGTASIGEDITERKRAEDEVLRLNADLERRVIKRTAALEAANNELEAFDYSISHDLKAPIRHIDGFSTMLIEEYGDRLDERGRSCLQRIQGAAHRMEQLVDDLLSLSLVSRGEMNRKEVDLSALAQQVCAGLRQVEPGRDVDCVVASGLTAHADAGLMRIVLENLIGNAQKFSAGRSGTKIEFGSVTAESGPVYFVRDNGVGFDAAYADKLFAPFQRLHAQNEFTGTGIGLATVRRIIARHGGKVWAEGVVNQGATIHFTLPR